MTSIFTIAKKEFLDTLRDRRTLLIMIGIPLILFPAIFYVAMQVQKNVSKEAGEKTLKVGLIEEGQAPELVSMIEQAPAIDLIKGINIADTAALIRSDSLNMVLLVDKGFTVALDSMETAKVQLYFKRTDDSKIRARLEAPIKAYEQKILAQRMAQLGISKETIDPVFIDTSHNVDSKQEMFGKMAGGFLPYIFVIFSFLGCMYPAIDLFTGEKERGTLETILTLPVNRLHILTGKMVVVASSGIISALVAILSLVLSLNFLDIGESIKEPLLAMLSPSTVILLFALIIPLAIFFAGVQVAFATYAKSFKEAQSMISPLNILVIVPAAIGLMPGIELNLGTALIPILNVALATKEILAGTIDYGLLAVVFLSLIILAGGAVIFSIRWFAKEGNILRA